MNSPGYTLVRREDCPEQHGVLTVIKTESAAGRVLLLTEWHISFFCHHFLAQYSRVENPNA